MKTWTSVTPEAHTYATALARIAQLYVWLLLQWDRLLMLVPLQRSQSVADCNFGLVFQEAFGKSWGSQSISAILDYFDPIGFLPTLNSQRSYALHLLMRFYFWFLVSGKLICCIPLTRLLKKYLRTFWPLKYLKISHKQQIFVDWVI